MALNPNPDPGLPASAGARAHAHKQRAPTNPALPPQPHESARSTPDPLQAPRTMPRTPTQLPMQGLDQALAVVPQRLHGLTNLPAALHIPCSAHAPASAHPPRPPTQMSSPDVRAGLTQSLDPSRTLDCTPIQGAHTMQGLERALAAGAREVAIFPAATEAFSQRNLNCSLADSLRRFQAVAEGAHRAGIRVRGYVSCAVGCPYQVPWAPRKELAEPVVGGAAVVVLRTLEESSMYRAWSAALWAALPGASGPKKRCDRIRKGRCGCGGYPSAGGQSRSCVRGYVSCAVGCPYQVPLALNSPQIEPEIGPAEGWGPRLSFE